MHGHFELQKSRHRSFFLGFLGQNKTIKETKTPSNTNTSNSFRTVPRVVDFRFLAVLINSKRLESSAEARVNYSPFSALLAQEPALASSPGQY